MRAKEDTVAAQRRGFTLIIVILVLAFLLSVGIGLLSVTGTAPKIADNVRSQEMALSAAEAGFDLAWESLENAFSMGQWTSFEGHYLKDPTGIDLASDPNYFRKLTDVELLALLDQDADGEADYANVLFFKQTFQESGPGSFNQVLTYTVFLIDDEAAGGTPDASDVLLVCIGTSGAGANTITSRLEVELQAEASVGP